LNAWVKDAWVVSKEYEPPFGHAELLSLAGFSQKMEIDLDAATAELRSSGIEFENPQQSLEEVAAANGVSPMDLYLLIKKFEPAPASVPPQVYSEVEVEAKFAGTGLGNQTVADIAGSNGLEMTIAAERLAANGVVFTEQQTLKQIADDNDLAPIDLMKIMLVPDYRARP
jgi:hypothetical protein